MKQPHRRHRLVLDLHADTLPDLCRALENLALDLEGREGSLVGSWGGPSVGANYEYIQDPDVDHESYFAELKAWLAAKREEAKP